MGVGTRSFMSDLELIRCCAESNDSSGWQEFVVRFQRPIRLSIIRTANRWGQLPGKVLDDLAQETYLKLCEDGCRLLLQFAVQHPEAVSGYIKVIAVNLAHDYFKAAYSKKRGGGQAHESLAQFEPKTDGNSLGDERSIERQILIKQIDACLDTASNLADRERDRSIFWMYYIQGLSAKAISALPTVGLTAKGVESAILRLTKHVRGQIVHARIPDSGSDFRTKGFRTPKSY
jgi:RNA polymerase sigma-70 factor (ECF subfamily)